MTDLQIAKMRMIADVINLLDKFGIRIISINMDNSYNIILNNEPKIYTFDEIVNNIKDVL